MGNRARMVLGFGLCDFLAGVSPSKRPWGNPFAVISSLSCVQVALTSGTRRRGAVTRGFAGTAATHDQVCHKLRGCATVR